jgi:hypothetical protein
VLENVSRKRCWKTVLENSVGKWCWKSALEYSIGKQHQKTKSPKLMWLQFQSPAMALIFITEICLIRCCCL